MQKTAPLFWWNFAPNGDVIVRGDWAGGECLERFAVIPGASAEAQIAAAEALIADFRAGRRTPLWGRAA